MMPLLIARFVPLLAKRSACHYPEKIASNRESSL
jgi:hypothetical protein